MKVDVFQAVQFVFLRSNFSLNFMSYRIQILFLLRVYCFIVMVNGLTAFSHVKVYFSMTLNHKIFSIIQEFKDSFICHITIPRDTVKCKVTSISIYQCMKKCQSLNKCRSNECNLMFYVNPKCLVKLRRRKVFKGVKFGHFTLHNLIDRLIWSNQAHNLYKNP